ncbi:MAG: tyrosine-type recombinase/integrase [Negativicutes bacterium]|nr:tyrosine-type recombinase/integrase [Negativicutes bacterium]
MIRNKDGKIWVVKRYFDVLENRHEKWFGPYSSERAAAKADRTLQVDIDRGDLVLGAGQNLTQYLEAWLETFIKPEKRQNTYLFYQSNVNQITKGLGKFRLEKLSPLQIQTHLNNERSRGLLPTSIKAQYSTLLNALKRAVKLGLIAKNPCDNIDPPQKNKPKRQAVTPADAARILALFESTPIIYNAIILGLSLGLRRGEMCGLRWADFDFKKQTVRIEWQLDRVDGILDFVPVKTAGSEARKAVPDYIIPQLKELQHQQKKDKFKFSKSYKNLDLVLCWQDGSPVDPDFVYHRFVKTIKAHNKAIDTEIEKAKKENRSAEKHESEKVPLIKIHDLRHTYATFLLYSGINAKAAAKEMRHQSAKFMVDTYQHIIEEVQRDPAAAIDKIFKGWGEKEGENKEKES